MFSSFLWSKLDARISANPRRGSTIEDTTARLHASHRLHQIIMKPILMVLVVAIKRGDARKQADTQRSVKTAGGIKNNPMLKRTVRRRRLKHLAKSMAAKRRFGKCNAS